MEHGLLAGRTPYVIYPGGEAEVNGITLSDRDCAFLCYYLLKTGNTQGAEAYLPSAAPKVAAGTASFHATALWLWVLGEYAGRAVSVPALNTYDSAVRAAVAFLERECFAPQEDWLGVSGEGVYLVNLAMAYGALRALLNVRQDDHAKQLSLEIERRLFERFLDEGRVVSRLAEKEITGDICAVAVPFALIDAGNQLLVESMRVVEKTLMDGGGVRLSPRDLYYGGCVRSELTCLCAWYYSERGDIARAKRLLACAASMWNRDGKLYAVDPRTARETAYYEHSVKKYGQTPSESAFAYILYAIAEDNVLSRQGGAEHAGPAILHSPGGTGNRYLSETNQRLPVWPVEEEDVLLRALTEPFSASQTISAEVYVNGGAVRKAPMRAEVSPEGEPYWEANIGRFGYGDTVTYRFTVEDGSETSASEEFVFTVRAWKPLGPVQSVRADDGEISLRFAPFAGNAAVPCLRFTKMIDRTAAMHFSVEEAAPETYKDFSELRLDLGPYTLSVHTGEPGFTVEKSGQSVLCACPGFLECLLDSSGAAYGLRMSFACAASERFYGMGERFSRIEHSGHDVDVYVYNQYTHQEERTYIPAPFAISSAGYGIYLDSARYSLFRFGTRRADRVEIEAELSQGAPRLTTYFFLGTPKEALRGYCAVSGMPALPPKWAFGLWMSSHNWDSQAETLKQVALTQAHGIPSTALVLEQWSDEATFYIFNDAQYPVKGGAEAFSYKDFTFPAWGRWPDPRAMVEEIHRAGIRVLLWQPPVEKYMDGIAHAQRDEDERYMLEQGYYVHCKDGSPYRVASYEWFKRSLIPDFTNPAARDWWLGKRGYTLRDIGIDGFKTDGGECVHSPDTVFFDGRAGDEMHNLNPNVYIGSFHAFVREETGGNGVTFSRAGFAGAQTIPLHWAGDEFSDFRAFNATMNAGLSCGMSGIPFWGWDIGGFHGEIPTAELYIRGFEMAAFCPVMQYHAETKGERNRDRTPWNIAEQTNRPEVIGFCRRYANLRMNLLPYIYSQAMESCETGVPLMRAMALEYPEDPTCARLAGQYHFGDALLVAPVTEENRYLKSVYLPHGQWMELFTGAIVQGGRTLTVRAALDEIPVYIRENSILALNLDSCLALGGPVGNRTDGYENLCLLLFVTGEARCMFRDDLGNALEISAVRARDSLAVTLSGRCDVPVTLITRAGAICGGRLDGAKLLQARYGEAITCEPGRSEVLVKLPPVTAGCERLLELDLA